MLTSSASRRRQKIRRLDIAASAGQRAAAQHVVNMDIAVGDDLRAGADGSGNDEIGAAGVDLGSRPHRLAHEPGPDGRRAASRRGWGRGRRRRVRLRWRGPRGWVEFGAKLANPASAAAASWSGCAFCTPIRLSVWRRSASFASTNCCCCANSRRVPQIEHHRRVQKKSGASLHLLGKSALEGGIAQHLRANHHDGEHRALHQTNRHPRTVAACANRQTYRLAPNRACRNGFAPKEAGSHAPVAVELKDQVLSSQKVSSRTTS